MAFFGVVPKTFILLTPFSLVLLHLLIAFLAWKVGMVVLRVDIFSLSLVVWVWFTFSLLRL